MSFKQTTTLDTLLHNLIRPLTQSIRLIYLTRRSLSTLSHNARLLWIHHDGESIYQE